MQDPLEILGAQIDCAIERQNEVGPNHCMVCGKEVNYELISASEHPAAWAVCYECLSPVNQKKYDQFIAEKIYADI